MNILLLLQTLGVFINLLIKGYALKYEIWGNTFSYNFLSL